MPRLSWDKFVTKHRGVGHLVSTGTQPKLFTQPAGISQNNQKKWPAVPALLREAIGSSFAGDWSHLSTKVPGHITRNGKRVSVASAALHRFVFTDPADALKAAKYLSAASLTPEVSPDPGFASLIKGREIDTAEYLRLARLLGY